MGFEYKEIALHKIRDVSLISEQSTEYRDFLNEVRGGKSSGQKERERMIRNQPDDFQKYQNIVEAWTRSPENFIQQLQNWVADADRVCGHCRHSQDDSYRDGDEYIVCWKNTPNRTSKPRKLTTNDDFAEGCRLFHPEAPFSDDAPDSLADNERVRSVRRLIEDYPDNADDFLRKWILRVAWRVHLQDVAGDWNKQRAEAFLRDMDSMAAEQAQVAGKGGRDFERRVKALLFDEIGIPQLDTVFKIKMQNGNTRYKEMDIHTEIDGTPYIIEIFTQRSLDEKIKQLGNYAQLYEVAADEWPERVLLTDNTRIVSFKFLELLAETSGRGATNATE